MVSGEIMNVQKWIILGLLSSLMVSCIDSTRSALNELEANRYRFTSEDFLFAAASNDLDGLILFGKAGIDVNIVNKKGRTALMEAAKNGKLPAVRLLLGAGADPRMLDNRGRDALISAASGGHIEISRLLMSRGVRSDTRDKEGWNGLSLSSYHGHSEVVRLLAGSASQQKLDEALLLASFGGDYETVFHLLRQGASVNARNPKNLTPLMIAAENGHLEVVKLLFENNADPRLTAKKGVTATVLASHSGHETVSKYLKSGGKVTAVPKTSRAKSKEKPLVALQGSTLRSRDPKMAAISTFEHAGFHRVGDDGSYVVLTSPYSRYRFVAKSGDRFKGKRGSREARTFQIQSISQTDVVVKDMISERLINVRRVSSR